MPAEFEDTRFYVSDAEIQAETDADTLMDWRGEYISAITAISVQIDTAMQIPFVDRAWLARANKARRTNYYKLTLVLRRLTELGKALPSTSLAETAAHAEALEKRVSTLENELAQVRAAKQKPATTQPAMGDAERDGLKAKIASLQTHIERLQSSRQIERLRIAAERGESIARQFVDVARDRLPADQFNAILRSAQDAADLAAARPIPQAA